MMVAKPGENEPDKDIPLHGVEKKDDRACRHDYCTGPDCRLDVAADAIKRLGNRLDSIIKSRC
jgi:hypothetical protein